MRKLNLISQEAINLIKHFEGFSAKPYFDSAGIPTIGYGETQYPNGHPVRMDDEAISEDYADHLLMIDLGERMSIIDRFLEDQDLDLSLNQRGALLSFAYNLGWERVVGQGSVKRALITRRLHDVPNALRLYTKARNPVTGELEELRGLVRRREAECKLWKEGVFHA